MASADVEGEQGRGSPWEPGSQEGGCRAGAPVRPPTRLVWRASAPRTCAIDRGRPCAPPGSAERGVLTRDAKRGTGHVSLGRTLSTVPGPRGHHALRKQNRAREEAGVPRGRGRRGAGAGALSVSGGPWRFGTALAQARGAGLQPKDRVHWTRHEAGKVRRAGPTCHPGRLGAHDVARCWQQKRVPPRDPGLQHGRSGPRKRPESRSQLSRDGGRWPSWPTAVSVWKQLDVQSARRDQAATGRTPSGGRGQPSGEAGSGAG